MTESLTPRLRTSSWGWTQARRLVFLVVATASTLLSMPASALDLQGHRGARGLAPENTLAAFRQALAIGVTTLELDLGRTRDGQLVIVHDPRLNPAIARDEKGQWISSPGPAINSLSLEELQRFDVGRLQPGSRYAGTMPAQKPVDGERIPTLTTLFQSVKTWGADRVRFNIETKSSPLEPALYPTPADFAKAVVDEVQRHGLAERVTIQSFDWRTLREVQRLAPGLQTAALTSRQSWLDNVADPRWTGGLLLTDHNGSVPRLVNASGATTWSPYFGDLNESSLAEARSLGLKVIPWTINDPAVMARWIAAGVDGIITDYPDRLRAVMAERRIALPDALPVSSPARPASTP